MVLEAMSCMWCSQCACFKPLCLYSSPSPLLQSVNPASLGMTDFFDYTGAVNDIIGRVGNNSNVSQCCSYENQLLDQFCASRMAVSVWK